MKSGSFLCVMIHKQGLRTIQPVCPAHFNIGKCVTGLKAPQKIKLIHLDSVMELTLALMEKFSKKTLLMGQSLQIYVMCARNSFLKSHSHTHVQTLTRFHKNQLQK
jgi:hypothetical protein